MQNVRQAVCVGAQLTHNLGQVLRAGAGGVLAKVAVPSTGDN